MKKFIVTTLLVVLGLLAAGCSPGGEKMIVEKGSINPNGNIDEIYLLKYNNKNWGKKIESLDESQVKIPESKYASGDDVNLRIFHINDLQHHIADYHKDGDTYQMAQIKKIVDDTKGDKPTIFVSAGDDHTGTVFDELLGSTAEEFVTSPVYETYNAAGVDFTTFGNHEFDKQSAILEKMLEVPAFNVVSANIVDSAFDLNYSPAAIAVVDGLKVGVIGLTTIRDTPLNTITDEGLSGINPSEVIENILPAIEKEVDVIVLLTHLGYNGRDEDAAVKYKVKIGEREIAETAGKLTSKPTVVIGGHTHTVLNQKEKDNDNVYEGVLVAQAGEYGKFLGEIEINGTIGGEFTDSAKLHETKPGKPSKTKPDLVLQTEADYDVAFQTTIIDPLKKLLDEKMMKRLATVEENPDIAIDNTINDRYKGESAIANFMNDAIVKRSENIGEKLDFAVFNSSAINGIKSGGDIAYQDWYNVMPYADNIVIYELTGQDMKDFITDVSKRIYREDELMPSGKEDPSLFLERGFLHFSSGVRYEVALGATPMENEVKNITLHGKPIDDVLDETFVIAFNTYLSTGRGGWAGEPIGQGLPDSYKGLDLTAFEGHDTGLVYRNQIIEYILDDLKGVVTKEDAKKDDRVKIL